MLAIDYLFNSGGAIKFRLDPAHVYPTTVNIQCSKLTFSKSRLLATFNCKMVAIKKIKSPKQTNVKGEDIS